MRIKTIQLYSFDELQPEAQQRAVDKLGDINVDFNWYEDELDYWKEKLSEYGFGYPEIYFSGFGSQGDGACFEFNGVDIDKIWSHYVRTGQIKHEESIKTYLREYHHFKSRTINSRYSHERTREVDCECYCRHEYPHLDAERQKFESWLEEFRLERCREIYRCLETEYFDLISPEAVIDTIKANEYEFTEEGLIA